MCFTVGCGLCVRCFRHAVYFTSMCAMCGLDHVPVSVSVPVEMSSFRVKSTPYGGASSYDCIEITAHSSNRTSQLVLLYTMEQNPVAVMYTQRLQIE